MPSAVYIWGGFRYEVLIVVLKHDHFTRSSKQASLPKRDSVIRQGGLFYSKGLGNIIYPLHQPAQTVTKDLIFFELQYSTLSI